MTWQIIVFILGLIFFFLEFAGVPARLSWLAGGILAWYILANSALLLKLFGK